MDPISGRVGAFGLDGSGPGAARRPASSPQSSARLGGRPRIHSPREPGDHPRMSILSTGSPDPDNPRSTHDEPVSATAGRADGAGLDTTRLAGSPPPAAAAPHEGLIGTPDEPLGDDRRPGNVGQAAEAPITEDHEDLLDQASDESFPASDPPSWSAAPTLGEERPDPAVPSGQHGLGHVVDDQNAEAGAPD